MTDRDNVAKTRRRRVLVADDERHIVHLVAVNLRKAGFEVIPAYDAREAYQEAKQEQPDVIILDCCMPPSEGELIDGLIIGNLSGLAVVKALRADPSVRQVPIILLLPRPPDIAGKALWDEVADTVTFLYKPFDSKCLLALVFNPRSGAPERPVLEEQTREDEARQSPRRPWWRWWSR